MTARTKPPFRADHVGSLLRPAKLKEAREKFEKNALSRADLDRVEEEAVREVVKLQEDVGLKLVTDGEYRRKEWHMDFLMQFSNVKRVASQIKVQFHTHEGDIEVKPPGLNITGKLSRPKPIFVDHFKFLKTVTKVTAKQTIPSPTILHFRGGRAAVDKTAYPEMDGFFANSNNAAADSIDFSAK